MKHHFLATKTLVAFHSLALALMPLGVSVADQHETSAQQETSVMSTTPATAVSMWDNYYSPRHLTVSQGTTVTWTNMGHTPHTATTNNGSFNSGSLSPGQNYSYTFNTVGTFWYYCQFHSGMTGSITVVASQYPYPQPSPGQHSISGTVTSSPWPPDQGTLRVNYIQAVKTTGIADGTFENGWKWIFDISAPMNETQLMMRFSNWLAQNPGVLAHGSSFSVANNIRFYSLQSSNAMNENSAIYITAPNVYSAPMTLTGNLGGGQGRHIQITVQAKIPMGTPNNTYTSNFGIRTQ